MTNDEVRDWLIEYLTQPDDARACELATVACEQFPSIPYEELREVAAEVVEVLKCRHTKEPFSVHIIDENPIHIRLAVFNRGGLAGHLCVNTSDAAELMRRITQSPPSSSWVAFMQNRAVWRMEAIAEIEDTEKAHIAADNLMCDILRSLGYEEAVSIFLSMTAWYG